MKLRVYSKRNIRSGMRVIMRIDGNVPVKNGRVLKDGTRRLDVITPEIKRIVKRGARVILMTHFGRPNGKVDKKLSTLPITKYLSQKLEENVSHVPSVVGLQAQKALAESSPDHVFMLENLRFKKGEEKNDATFAKELAKFGDIYINNAFGVCHRKHASVHAITRFIDSYAGERLQLEVRNLSRRIKRPAVLVVGGIKLETKIPIIEHLAPQVSTILTAGGVAVALVVSERNKELYAGDQLVSSDDMKSAKRILNKYGSKIHLPIDFRVSRSENFKKLDVKLVEKLRKQDRLFDVGPETVKHYSDLLEGARTVIWNGPLGLIEKGPSAKSSFEIAKVIVEQRRARTIVGGGETVAFLDKKGIGDRFSFVSTGGGAMLAMYSGKKLPGIEVLKR